MTDVEPTAASISFGHVLLPLDGSSFAGAALPTAQALVARFGARLRTLVVADEGRRAEKLRAAVSESVQGQVVPEAIDVAVADDAAAAIVGRAGELGSCVVCMSTHGRGRVSGAVIGSVAREVLLRSQEPVVAVGPQADRPPALVGRPRRRPASWIEPLQVRRLVACVDGSRASEAVLSHAAGWANALGMSLSIVTVAEESAGVAGGGPANRWGPADPSGYVDELASRWSTAARDVAAEVVFDPIGVASGLRAHLAARPAGLVAVTTHARGGFARVRLGSTGADIVRASTAPSLVVPAPGA